MTLAEVAAGQRRLYPRPAESERLPQDRIFDMTKEGAFTLGLQLGVNQAIDHLEADPDFTLRERIEALLREWETVVNEPESQRRSRIQQMFAPSLGQVVGPLGPPLLQAEGAVNQLREALNPTKGGP